jgi:hypothetical protein
MTPGILVSKYEKIRLCNLSFSSSMLIDLKFSGTFYTKVILAAKKASYERELIKHQAEFKKACSVIKHAKSLC